MHGLEAPTNDRPVFRGAADSIFQQVLKVPLEPFFIPATAGSAGTRKAITVKVKTLFGLLSEGYKIHDSGLPGLTANFQAGD